MVRCLDLITHVQFNVPPPKSNINTKNDGFKMFLLSNMAILGIHVSFQGCNALRTSETILCLGVTAPIRCVRHDRWDRGVFQVGERTKKSPDRSGKAHFSGTKQPKLVFFFFLSLLKSRVFNFPQTNMTKPRVEIILSFLPQKFAR